MKADDLVTGIVEGITAFLVKTLLRPKVYFETPEAVCDKLPEPCIIVINHTGHLDGPMFNTMFRKNKMHCLAAKDRFEQKGFGFFLRHTRCIPIDRQSPDLSWVHTSLEVLHRQRENVIIFPEGRHGSHRSQLPFHPGVIMLAALAKLPVIMVYIDGPLKILGPRGRFMVSAPFTLPEGEAMNVEYLNAQTEFLQERMKSLMEEFVRRVTPES